MNFETKYYRMDYEHEILVLRAKLRLLIETYRKYSNNLKKSMNSISEDTEGFERWDARRSTYLEVIEQLEKILS